MLQQRFKRSLGCFCAWTSRAKRRGTSEERPGERHPWRSHCRSLSSHGWTGCCMGCHMGRNQLQNALDDVRDILRSLANVSKDLRWSIHTIHQEHQVRQGWRMPLCSTPSSLQLWRPSRTSSRCPRLWGVGTLDLTEQGALLQAHWNLMDLEQECAPGKGWCPSTSAWTWPSSTVTLGTHRGSQTSWPSSWGWCCRGHRSPPPRTPFFWSLLSGSWKGKKNWLVHTWPKKMQTSFVPLERSKN